MHVLAIPMDLGAGRRGVDMGPSALRLAQLEPTLVGLGHDLRDHGNVAVAVPEATRSTADLHFVEAIADACQRTFRAVRSMPEGAFPLLLGGDHSVTVGAAAGAAGEARTGLLWIDAHADLNTPETSPSGNVHGMPLAALLGHGDARLTGVWGEGPRIRPEDVVLIGLRETDEGERRLIDALGLRAFTMKEIDRRGIADVASEAIACLGGAERIHVSFDADALDPDLAPGVGTPVKGGLTYREAHLLMELLSDARRVTSLDVVEVNPILDVRNRTAEIMVEMVASLLGKRIL